MNKMQMFSSCTALTFMAVTFAGCTGLGQAAKPATAPAAAASPALLAGKVAETVDSGGYTYIKLEKDGKTTWVAAPVMKVVVGQEVQLLPGAEMTNFNSKTLNRTFDKIIFSGGAIAPAAPAAAAAQPEAAEEEVVMIGKVIETMPAGNYTYIRIEKDGKAAWAAVPRADVVVGDEVELAPGTAMGRFTSKTLNRTFNSIYFAGGVTVTSQKDATTKPAAPAAGSELPSGHPKLDPAAAPLPSGHPSLDAAAPAAPAAAAAISGKVVETINGGGYTYLCLEKGSDKTWVAVPSMKAKVGDEMAVHPGNVMTNFASKSLNRTFDKIIFSSGPVAK